MKEIMAIIRMNKVNQTKRALMEAGFPSITARKVMGRGKQKIDFTLVKHAIEDNVLEDKQLAEQFVEGHKLIPKRIFTMIVQDSEVKKAVDTIIKINQTGNPGDGKIFVLPIMETIRIRTGETGEEAV